MKDSLKLFYDLKETIDKIPIIDTHKHLIQEQKRLTHKPDLFETFLSHYLSSDLVSSGMSLEELADLRNPQLPLTDRWKVFKPFWERTKNTGYAYAINVAVKGLYDARALSNCHLSFFILLRITDYQYPLHSTLNPSEKASG